MTPAETAVRRRCTGVAFAHDPTFFSIAKAYELLRCPLCGFEIELGGAGR